MTSIENDVRRLEELDLSGLRAVWQSRYGRPPDLRSAELLRLMLAWRMQADIHGGLDAQTRRRLRGSTTATPRKVRLGDGARITREWQGALHEVEVGPDGYVWRGRSFASLSAVAKAITGVKWNGPKFFGLREEQSR